MRSLFVVCLGLSFVGCATAGSPGSGSLKNKSATPTLSSNAGGPNATGKYVCEYEEDTGSHLRNKVCRYIDGNAADRGTIQNEIINFEARDNPVSRPGG